MHMYRPLEEIPVLVGAGGILPMDAGSCPDNGCPLPETVAVRCFPGDGETVLIEDNGLLPEAPGYRRAVTGIHMRAGTGLTIEILPPEGDAGLLPARRRYIVEVIGIGNQVPDTCSSAFTSAYDGKRRSLTVTCEADAGQGLFLAWSAYDVPRVDTRRVIRDILVRAHIPVDVKSAVQHAADRLHAPLELLSELHTFDLPQALYGAIIEVLCAQ